MKGKELIILVVLLMVIVLVIGIIYFPSLKLPPPDLGSVVTGQEYYATGTPWDTAYTDGLITGGNGSLGSITITYAGNTEFRLLDATTTVAADRPAGRQATSAVEILRINSATVGTYVFDATFIDGLYLDVISGNTGTSTITFR